MWTLESRWFDVAAFSTLCVVLMVVFGHFEQHKPPWRRLAKLVALLVLLLLLVETLGRPWAYGILGLLLASGAAFHFTVLSKLGINGWTGEPRERFDALLREIALRGEVATLFRSLVARERGGKPETHTPTASATAPDVLTPTDRS